MIFGFPLGRDFIVEPDRRPSAKMYRWMRGAPRVVFLDADRINSNASANTIANVPGMSFTVAAGIKYWFKFTISFTANATTTGSRWAVTGPAAPTSLAYTSRYPLTATTEVFNHVTDYDLPAAAGATSPLAGVAIIEGFIRPSVAGTVAARFASEVSGAAITAKIGSFLEWRQVN